MKPQEKKNYNQTNITCFLLCTGTRDTYSMLHIYFTADILYVFAFYLVFNDPTSNLPVWFLLCCIAGASLWLQPEIVSFRLSHFSKQSQSIIFQEHIDLKCSVSAFGQPFFLNDWLGGFFPWSSSSNPVHHSSFCSFICLLWSGWFFIKGMVGRAPWEICVFATLIVN